MKLTSAHVGLNSNRPISGHLLPWLRRQKDSSNSDKEPRKLPFKLFNILDYDKETEKKLIDPHELRRAMFPLGVSLVNINVNSSGGAGRILKRFTFFPPLRHALYAQAIADGASNFVIGIIVASYTQSKDFCCSLLEEETLSLSFCGAMVGIWTQLVVYCCYGVFSIPIALFKLATYNEEQPQQV
ncbi:hypothetical protein DSO57_1020354 [Entomophthora muscae]|uniref:Uncharacterized protein n=1 Tax=Entomophthora muscae TaxID=34485 RepID=A0ACC2U1J1_9FUNG|nr:hypothetical protein DSO57_1020354 [Entomophthora muscae]